MTALLRILILTLLLATPCFAQQLPFFTKEGNWISLYTSSGAPATPVYTNSMYDVNRSAWSNSVMEYLMGDALSWTNTTSTNDTSYSGTNFLFLTGSSTDPLLKATTNNSVYGTNFFYSFDGVDDYIKGLRPAGLNPDRTKTLSFWTKINVNTFAKYAVISTRGSAGPTEGFGFILAPTAMQTNTIHYFHTGYGAGVIAQPSIVTGVWYNVAMTKTVTSATFTNGTVKLYLNGVEQSVFGSISAGVPVGTNLYIGLQGAVRSNASIDGVDAYDRILTSNEVYNKYISVSNRYPNP